MRDGWTGEQLGAFNVDGPHTPDLTVAAAGQLAELVRYLNHATIAYRADEALPEPADTARVLDGLATALQRLPQLLGQIAGHVTRQQPRLASADSDPDGTAAALVEAAAEAVAHIDQAGMSLRRSVEAANRLYLDEG